MTRSGRILSAAAVLGLAAGALVLSGRGHPARADAIDDAIKTFQDYLKTKPTADGLVNQIGDLAQKKDPRVAKAFLELLHHKEETVRIAVYQNIGKQGDPTVAGPLTSIFEFLLKEKEKEKFIKLEEAALEGIGDANAKGCFDYLIKMAKKFRDTQGDLSAAAYRAAANNVTAELVGELVDAAETCDAGIKQNEVSKREPRGKVKPVVNDLLKKITGQNINDAKIWKKWWDDNKKTWKPTEPGQEPKKDINAGDSFVDAAYGFEIRKPNTRWIFRKTDGDQGQVYLIMEILDEGQRAAWCELSIYGTKNYKEKTPELLAATVKDVNEARFKDIKPDSYWDKKIKISNESAVEANVFGRHKDLDAVQMRNFYVVKNEVMFQMMTYYKSGKPKSYQDDIDEIFKGGFKFKLK